MVVSTDDLFDGTFQQRILDVDKMISKTKIKLENEFHLLPLPSRTAHTNNNMRTKQNTVICPKYWKMSKKIHILSTKTRFFHIIIVKSFLDRFKTNLHQNIRNCLYFVLLFTHAYMSGFYLYLIFPWFKFLGFIFSWNI